jgi:hypothetical protein
MLSAARTGTLQLFMVQGGSSRSRPDPFMDIDAERVQLLAPRLYRSGEPAIRLRRTVRFFDSVLAPQSRMQEDSSNVTGLNAFPDGTDDIRLRDVEASQFARTPGKGTTPWEPPAFGPIPDPAGSNWLAQSATAPDDRPRLQRLIDEQGIVRLPAGVFHIAAPLRLKRGQGIIGAGADRTAIVATSADIDMIVGDDHLAQPQPTSLVLIDLTLQGGRVGIRHDARGSGAGAQYVYSQLSHVVFRDLSEAGILIDGIYGWDNNLLDELTFYRLPIGVEQRPNPAYVSAAISGNVPGTNYLDKNLCYRCRFEQLDTGLMLGAKRANNLNACVNCRFVANRNGAIRLRYSNSTIIANSDFVADTGQPLIRSDQPVGILSSRFTAASSGSLLDVQAICEACEFHAAAQSRALIANPHVRVVLLNSVSQGVALGPQASALLIDSRMPGFPDVAVLQVTGGRRTVLRPGVSRPRPELLVDWSE